MCAPSCETALTVSEPSPLPGLRSGGLSEPPSPTLHASSLGEGRAKGRGPLKNQAAQVCPCSRPSASRGCRVVGRLSVYYSSPDFSYPYFSHQPRDTQARARCEEQLLRTSLRPREGKKGAYVRAAPSLRCSKFSPTFQPSLPSSPPTPFFLRRPAAGVRGRSSIASPETSRKEPQKPPKSKGARAVC